MSSMGWASWAMLLAAATLAAPAAAVDIEWVEVDAPGNPDDDQQRDCCPPMNIGVGAVPYVFRISAFETTNGQYAEFLNAVAASDPNLLYNERMSGINITQRENEGEYQYAAVPGAEQRPIGFIDFYDALRFANWLHNGQPVGPQDEHTTEDGAYMLLGASPPQVARNEDARVFLTSQDEWFKAAYYDPVVQDYWIYPIGTDAAPVGEPPPGGSNSANFCPAVNRPVNCPPDSQGPGAPTDVGAYVDASSPFGTFDQGGNHLEWNEELVWNETEQRWDRGFRGGWYQRGPLDLSSRIADQADPNAQNIGGMGFRVATVSEPGAAAGSLVAALTLFGLARRRR